MALNAISPPAILELVKAKSKYKTKLSGEDAWMYREKELKEVINEIITIIKQNI